MLEFIAFTSVAINLVGFVGIASYGCYRLYNRIASFMSEKNQQLDQLCGSCNRIATQLETSNHLMARQGQSLSSLFDINYLSTCFNAWTTGAGVGKLLGKILKKQNPEGIMTTVTMILDYLFGSTAPAPAPVPTSSDSSIKIDKLLSEMRKETKDADESDADSIGADDDAPCLDDIMDRDDDDADSDAEVPTEKKQGSSKFFSMPFEEFRDTLTAAFTAASEICSNDKIIRKVYDLTLKVYNGPYFAKFPSFDAESVPKIIQEMTQLLAESGLERDVAEILSRSIPKHAVPSVPTAPAVSTESHKPEEPAKPVSDTVPDLTAPEPTDPFF